MDQSNQHIEFLKRKTVTISFRVSIITAEKYHFLDSTKKEFIKRSLIELINKMSDSNLILEPVKKPEILPPPIIIKPAIYVTEKGNSETKDHQKRIERLMKEIRSLKEENKHLEKEYNKIQNNNKKLKSTIDEIRRNLNIIMNFLKDESYSCEKRLAYVANKINEILDVIID